MLVLRLYPGSLTPYDCTIDEDDGWTVRTIDGSLSAQWEHTVVVTEDGIEILTL